MKKSLYTGILLSAMMLASNAQAVTWCPQTNIKDVICYSDKTCYISADSYGGVRAYLISGVDENRKLMLGIALSALHTKLRARIAFAPDNLNCNDIPLNTLIFGVGVMD